LFYKFIEKEKLVLFQIPENLQLHSLPEGKIGKLRVRKSGRVEFYINDDKNLNVSLSVSGQFLQVKTQFLNHFCFH
jgi:hypothetical protein